MLTYSWRCSICGKITEVERSIADCEVPPDECPHYKDAHDRVPEIAVKGEWTKVITSAPPVMWEDARDKGVFDRIYKV